MKILILQIIIFILFFPLTAFSQPTIDVLAGIFYPSSDQEDNYSFLENHWKPGISLGICTPIKIFNWLGLNPYLSYEYYFYHSYHVLAHTEEEFVATSGEGSHVFRFMAELQLIDHSLRKFNPYLTIGGGYIYEKVGFIHGRLESMGVPVSSENIGGLNNHYIVYSVGFGSIISLSTDFSLDLSVKHFSNTIDRFYYLIGAKIIYQFLN